MEISFKKEGMNVFLTGASGLVGRAVIELLHCSEHIKRIYCLYRYAPTILPSSKIIPIESDLQCIDEVIVKRQIHITIHLAGHCNGISGGEDVFYRTNVTGTEKVISFCKRNDIMKILYMSSINVHLQEKGDYAKSKLMAEAIVRSSDIPYMIIRSSLIYGNGDKGMSKICELIHKTRYFPVIGNGQALEQAIHVKEVAQYIMAGIVNFKRNITFDIGGLDIMTYDEMIQILAREMNRRIRLIHIPLQLVRLGIKVIKKAKIPIDINIEQIAHVTEDLTVNLREMQKVYAIELQPFIENIKQLEYVHK